MSENISLSDLLNLSIGTPQRGAVNFSALHALLEAVLRQLGIRELKTPWRDTPPGDVHPVAALQRDHRTEEVQPGTELGERISSSSSPTPSSGPAADDQRLRSRIQTCEDGVSQVRATPQQFIIIVQVTLSNESTAHLITNELTDHFIYIHIITLIMSLFIL